jgi:hypothetical protein
MPGKIITFYSYKGGTGRTMALANSACLLAAAGHRVLVIDWDLEAPGLHRYLHPFLPDPNLSRTPGIIDLVWDYSASATNNDRSRDANFDPLSLADPAHVVVPTSFPGGVLDFIGAGAQNPIYADRVRGFDWGAMFSRLDGAAFVKRFGENCRNEYEFTLIDSRTGIADIAGVATISLPDRVVLCFTANRQSVLGTRAIGDSIRQVRASLSLLPVVMRVEKGVEGWREAQTFYREQLDCLLCDAADSATRTAYWGIAEIVHYPNYALGELLAAFNDRPAEQNSLLSDMRRLVSRIVETEFMSLQKEFEAPSFSEEARRNYARRIRFRDPRNAELQAALEGDPTSSLSAIMEWAIDERQKVDFDPDWMERLAFGLTIVATRLGDAGDRVGALNAISEAVNARRRLTQDNSARFSSDLAASLHNMGVRLSNLGRREEALTPWKRLSR